MHGIVKLGKETTFTIAKVNAEKIYRKLVSEIDLSCNEYSMISEMKQQSSQHLQNPQSATTNTKICQKMVQAAHSLLQDIKI